MTLWKLLIYIFFLGRVFPARAGLNRVKRLSMKSRQCVPRTRGAEPPYNPAKDGAKSKMAQKVRADLGLAPIERAKKSPNAHTEELAGGAKRGKHRFLVTTPEARRAAYEEIKQGQETQLDFLRHRYLCERAEGKEKAKHRGGKIGLRSCIAFHLLWSYSKEMYQLMSE